MRSTLLQKKRDDLSTLLTPTLTLPHSPLVRCLPPIIIRQRFLSHILGATSPFIVNVAILPMKAIGSFEKEVKAYQKKSFLHLMYCSVYFFNFLLLSQACLIESFYHHSTTKGGGMGKRKEKKKGRKRKNKDQGSTTNKKVKTGSIYMPYVLVPREPPVRGAGSRSEGREWDMMFLCPFAFEEKGLCDLGRWDKRKQSTMRDHLRHNHEEQTKDKVIKQVRDEWFHRLMPLP